MYETQAALRLLHARGNTSDGGAPHRTAARVADAAALLEALPAANKYSFQGAEAIVADIEAKLVVAIHPPHWG